MVDDRMVWQTPMALYQTGDYVKVEFRNGLSGEAEWMWVRVSRSDDAARIVFGTLDNEPIVDRSLRLGTEFAVSYDNIREHMKPEAFNQ
jgi:hypothetical protein